MFVVKVPSEYTTLGVELFGNEFVVLNNWTTFETILDANGIYDVLRTVPGLVDVSKVRAVKVPLSELKKEALDANIEELKNKREYKLDTLYRNTHEYRKIISAINMIEGFKASL